MAHEIRRDALLAATLTPTPGVTPSGSSPWGGGRGQAAPPLALFLSTTIEMTSPPPQKKKSRGSNRPDLATERDEVLAVLNDCIARARKKGDYRAMLRAAKAKAEILGLHRPPPAEKEEPPQADPLEGLQIRQACPQPPLPEKDQ